MNLTRRHVIAALAGVPLAAPAALAQAPAGGRTVKIVVPFPAGGSTDVIARIIGERLAAIRGTPVVIENKPGAGGHIGADQVMRAPPDGAEMLLASVAISSNHHIVRRLNFDPARDLTPVSLVSTVPNALLVSPKVAAKSVAGLIALAKASPGVLTYGSAGIGTSAHLAGALFCLQTGIVMNHVPYRGTGPALNDLVGGHLDVLFDILTAAIPQIRSGAATALGVTSLGRNAIFPELAPVAETVPGFEAATWNLLLLPPGASPELASALAADVATVLADPAVKARLAALSVETIGTAPPEAQAFLRRESEKWGALVKAAGITAAP